MTENVVKYKKQMLIVLCREMSVSYSFCVWQKRMAYCKCLYYIDFFQTSKIFEFEAKDKYLWGLRAFVGLISLHLSCGALGIIKGLQISMR